MPGRPSLTETLDFNAPTGRRVRFISGLCVAIIGGAMAVDIALALTLKVPSPKFWTMAFAPLIGLVVILPLHLHAQVRGYRLTEHELQVLRRGRKNGFALGGLDSVEIDPKALERAVKVFGNDGLGAITGKFNSAKLGHFEALLTDPERAVVLRWPDRCLVVSPDRPEEFAAMARARAGLRR